MPEPRKAAGTIEIRLDLYALAQVRADEVWAATEKRCADCPGPEADGGCLTRKAPGVMLGRSDWPFCPRGMTRVRAWRALVNRYVDAQVSPLAGFPERYKAWAAEGFRRFRAAIRAEDERAAKAAAKPGGLPRYRGRAPPQEG